jgi:tRNA dimethylallyltransferase
VDEMVAAGAAEQVRAVDAAGASRTARAALGFEELLRGDIEATKRRTRNYAKRQLTWMRRLADVHRIEVTDLAPEAAARQIAHILAARPGAD